MWGSVGYCEVLRSNAGYTRGVGGYREVTTMVLWCTARTGQNGGGVQNS